MAFPSRHCEAHALRGGDPSVVKSGLRIVALLILGSVLAAFCGPGVARAQQEHKRKVPGLDKITSGPAEQAFSGIVQSVDLHHQLLNVNTVQGENTEIFPLRKGTRVATANGGRKRLSQLTPGTNVLIYYEQRGDRRTVKQIVVLGAAPAKDKKASPPPS